MSTSSKLTEPIIRVTDVSKVFGRQKEQALKLRESGQSKYEVEQATKTTVAIYNAHFEVKKGETFVLIGLSGSGKSTLLRCLNGLVEPTEGAVYLENTDISHMSKRQLQEVRRNKIGMVFQNVGLLPNRTVIDNITFGLEIQGVSASEREKRGKEALEMVGLNGQAYKRIYELSGGMQQRVGLARALASEQEILLMDEPFSALDPLIRRDMQKLFLDIQGEVQKTVIFVTHDLDEALTLGHRAAVMKDGEIVQLGTAEDILSQPATDYVKLLVQDVNYGKIRLAKDAVVPVETAAYEYESPQVVLRRMRTNHLSTIFVLDSADRLLGLMSIYTVMELIEAHKHDLKGKEMTQPHCVNPDMSLQEMIPLFTDSHSPVVIVDNHHRLQGMISPSTLIANLTERTAVTEQQEVKSYQMEVR
ncbi:betaine/proline/choline family ABC transporter ATP-binding protein [Priestia sp. Y58]|uniref:quaternary amine ABC transporter ATP-binding protein n=1 Tax=Priestia TaxID=2800373 RepID=UPI001C8ECD36|nr:MULTISPECIES: betaine/proline/choline family ABC transporter ATP-binding protein [Priestia]MBX9985406.1 betaine/proline/choline family ABC transporter ATP-binding protein [Priestia aryabhattai]MBY0003313.1 betaine/proline/choline family ABC transporter ATP-binding protein [Priestia aryabhattai]MCZ8494552.1 betaine/proline/choline family ABC transporter ATP-binding protein [Priestia megaterium]MDG0032890.1 betaine/proline/choline family ABC transporter ATP-binding protein [Priestia sp. Y58]M